MHLLGFCLEAIPQAFVDYCLESWSGGQPLPLKDHESLIITQGFLLNI